MERSLIGSEKMQKSKIELKNIKINKAFKLKHLINVLPLKTLSYSLFYVMAFAKNNNKLKNETVAAKEAMMNISEMINGKKGLISGVELQKRLHEGVESYLNLYYKLDGEFKNIAISLPHNNIIAIPAILKQKGKSKEEVSKRLEFGLYMKPFEFINSEIEKLKRIEYLQDLFMLSADTKRVDIEKISKIIHSVNAVTINPEKDDTIKDSIINEIASNDYVFEYVYSKLEERTFNIENAKRIIRT
ncbi:MAG: hypothetical protein QW045_00095 [Candidatus Micrarchaeaceae archaeon]